jgi:DNA polymerase III delta prime subunit
LVGWQSYYRAFLEDSAGRALIDHRGPYAGDDLRQMQVIEAMVSGRKVFLISAPPGCGKSRFALELARRIGRDQRSWEVRFVRHDEPSLRQELYELTGAPRRVLIVDDAHECPDLVQHLALLSADPGGHSPIHLVCFTQPFGRAQLIEALAGHFPLGEPLELDLGRPEPKLVRELIDKRIPHLSPHHRDVIRRLVADSFFVPVLLCSSVSRQKTLPQTLSTRNLRDYAIRQPVCLAVRDLCSADKAFRALAVYVACAPTRSIDTAIRSNAATLAGLSLADVEMLLHRVLEAGLFQADGRGLIRPVPGLLGDLILEETCLDEQGGPTPFGQSLIRTLFEQQRYEPVMRNCGDVARLFAAPARVDLVSGLVLERANGLAESQSEVLELLDSCSFLAARQPGTIVRLIEALTATGTLRAAPAARELSRPDNPEIRAQRLLTMAGESDPALVPRALAYSRGLLTCARPDVASYQSVRDSLTASCQFAAARSLAHAAAILDVLKGWREGSDQQAAELAAALLQGFLRVEMGAHRRERDSLAPVSVSLNPAEEVLKLRDRALDILVRCARHTAPSVQYAAVDSLRHWAQGYNNLTAQGRELWAPHLNRELNTLAETFSELGSTTSHLPVRAAVEHQGWRWWTDGAEPFIRHGGKRILEALPRDQTYLLWKALHDARLPIVQTPLDESMEPQQRRDHLLTLIEPPAERVMDLAFEVFDRLDPLGNEPSAWSAAFTSVLSAQPKHALQPQAAVYLAEFVRRHRTEAWSLVSEESAQGPLGAILPLLLAELREQDPLRWREAIQRSVPGTRLFEVELSALCAAVQLDPLERALVSKGLELDDAQSIHLAAQALLNANRTELAGGLATVFAMLPQRPDDERLWELVLDAFARWGDHVLSAPEGDEADPQMRATSGELLRLLRTYGSSLSWRSGPHAERLATVAAIFAVAIPHTLKSWMRELWSSAVAHPEGEPPLSADRMPEVVRLMGKSSTAAYWRKQFAEWMTEEPSLASPGAKGLAELCGLADPCVAPLVARIAQQPTSFALEAFGDFVGSQGDSARFIEDALTLLRNFADTPEAYDLLEKQIIYTMTTGRFDTARGGDNDHRMATLSTIDRLTHKSDLPPALLGTLARARQAMQAAIEEDVLRGDARSR